MSDQIYYHSFLNRDRMIHIVDADPATCEALIGSWLAWLALSSLVCTVPDNFSIEA